MINTKEFIMDLKLLLLYAELPNGIMLVAKRIKIDKNGMIEYGNGFTLHKFE